MRNWFITGISSGLGMALAKAVIDKGDFVIGTFRKQIDVDTYNTENIGKAFAVKMDITEIDQIDDIITELINKFKKIDVLVNNAGVGFVGAIEESSIDEIRAIFESNFFGTIKLTQAVLPYMRQERSGTIVQISSHGGVKAFAGFGIYNASKFALEGFSEALAMEVEPLGITIKIVEPGPFRTKFASDNLRIAVNFISDYSSTAGVFRKKLKSVDGKQEGDPTKAAEAIIIEVESDNNTLRLPLGNTALITIGMKLESIKSDLEFHRNTAEKVVFD